MNKDQISRLDNPAWSALTSDHRPLSSGGALARRYDPAISVFAGMEAEAPEAYAELGSLLQGDGKAVLFTPQQLTPPGDFTITALGEGFQMVAQTVAPPVGAPAADFIRLTAEDVPEMQQLVELTKPGPFAPRTIELGQYLGVRENGTLAAMAGERMRFGEFVEISAVCVHPDHRGKQLAHKLMLELAARIMTEGRTPILHVFTSNSPAIALYEKLGFVIRQSFKVSLLGLT
jgi:predicted GNAT family acetyltransferase